MMRPYGILLMLICLILVSGCAPDFTDQSQNFGFSHIDYKANLLYEEGGRYGSPIWLTEKIIAFTYDPPYSEGYPQDSRIHVHDITNRKWSEIYSTSFNVFNAKYDILYLAGLSRLPNGNLGIIYHSYGDGSGTTSSESQGIVDYDVNSGKAKIIKQYDDDSIGLAVDFSYSPDMTELIQEDGAGMLLSTKLYYIDSSNNMTQLVPDFIRADRPAWSPHKREIAFWGTEKLSGGMQPTQITNDFDLINIVYHPWDLYLSAPDGSNLRKIVSSVRNHRSAQWSPMQENIIAFSGIYEDAPGIWLLDLDTMKITRIYDDVVNSWDWSLDGNRLAITKETSGVDDLPNHEYIIGVLNLESAP